MDSGSESCASAAELGGRQEGESRQSRARWCRVRVHGEVVRELRASCDEPVTPVGKVLPVRCFQWGDRSTVQDRVCVYSEYGVQDSGANVGLDLFCKAPSAGRLAISTVQYLPTR